MRALPLALIAAISATPLAQAQSTNAIPPAEANEALAEAAEAARQRFQEMTFEEYRDSLPRKDGDGAYIVNGDVPIRNEKLLLEFFTDNVQNRPSTGEGAQEWIVATSGGLDKIWNEAQRHQLTYCVSTAFGTNYASVRDDMEAAAAAWEAVADLDFTHITAEDDNCNRNNMNVLFDVRPVNAGGRFLAAAFFPNDPRRDRSVVIDPSSFQLDPNGLLTLRGILRHELGHVIGGRHEHTRPEAGACFEDNDWRVVTNYDAFSVMHYPQCNGRGDWSLRLTDTDKSGVACTYGPAPGFTIDPAICAGASAPPAPTTTTFGPTSVAQGAISSIGTFDVVGGTTFTARMTGSGDPDLYVKFGPIVQQTFFDCRPYDIGADEVCDLDVPDDATQVSVMVRGYRAGEFELELTLTAP